MKVSHAYGDAGPVNTLLHELLLAAWEGRPAVIPPLERNPLALPKAWWKQFGTKPGRWREGISFARPPGPEETRMRREAMELLEIVGLAELKDETASNLPYGQQRRLEIARALATDPRLLILDEPAAGMNPQETVELTEFIREIREQFDLSILLIEHHMNLVMGISDRIYVLEFGKLIAEGIPEAVQMDQRVIDAYLGVDLDA